MMPYGAGAAAVTGATSLLPVNAYGTNYVLTTGYDRLGLGKFEVGGPSTDLVAAENDTSVTIVPSADIQGAPDVTPAPAGEPVTYKLDAGQILQLTQFPSLTGSTITSDKPIGMFAGHTCTGIGAQCCCDHIESQIPPVPALGNEFLLVGYRPRTKFAEHYLYRFVGAVDGTTLSYDPPVGGPTSLGAGQSVEFNADAPFIVRSQDGDHPFIALTYMSSANNLGTIDDPQGYGDPEVVRAVPIAQQRNDYIFFTDPTYPETNLVITRKRGGADVTLDCTGTLTGWQPIDARGEYEFTRIDLVRYDFRPQGNCDNGRHEMTSNGPFGLTVWGWGSPETTTFTSYVSYGYPAGENLGSINHVVIR
jgi:hypothetical protein